MPQSPAGPIARVEPDTYTQKVLHLIANGVPPNRGRAVPFRSLGRNSPVGAKGPALSPWGDISSVLGCIPHGSLYVIDISFSILGGLTGYGPWALGNGIWNLWQLCRCCGVVPRMQRCLEIMLASRWGHSRDLTSRTSRMNRSNGIHFGVVGIGGSRGATVGGASHWGQRSRRAVGHAGWLLPRGWRTRQPPSKPSVSEGSVGRHTGHGIPFQTSSDEVEKHGIVAALEGRLKLAGTGGTSRFASARPASI